MRMAHGESLKEACYTACKAVMAAVNGRIDEKRDFQDVQKEIYLNGYRSVVRLEWMGNKKAWVVTGYKDGEKNSSADDRRRATHLAADYALDSFGGLKEVGAALDYAISRLAREYKQNNADVRRKAVMAAVNGSIDKGVNFREHQKETSLNGYRSVVRLK